MLEPLIVLTVLNCFVMFSSAVTTCALWWQYHGHRCCPRKTATQQKFDLKRSKNTSPTVKNQGKLGFKDYAVSKSGAKGSHEHRSKNQRERSKKNFKYGKSNGENISFPDGLEITKFDGNAKLSEASQTVNDTKSTVVMEFSTVQKVVQIVDANSDVNSMRAPFKEIVIQKDTDKKHNHIVEQNFESTVTAT